MKKPFSAGVRYAIYAVCVLLAAASCVLLAGAYFFKQTCYVYVWQAESCDTPQRLLAQHPSVYENASRQIVISRAEMNGLITAVLTDTNSIPQRLDGAAYIPEENRFYLNVTDEEGKLYSFSATPAFTWEDKTLHIGLSAFLLGKSERLAEYYREKLDIPIELSFALNPDHELFYLGGIEYEPEGVRLVYPYDWRVAAQSLGRIAAQGSDQKVLVQGKQEKVSPALYDFLDGPSEKDAERWLHMFESQPDTFRQLCMLLTDDGIRMLQNEFGPYYNTDIPTEELIRQSEEEVNLDLALLHDRLSKSILRMLYDNWQYTLQDGTLFIGGQDVSALLTQSGANDIYTIRVVADGSHISVQYELNGDVTEMLVLAGETV